MLKSTAAAVAAIYDDADNFHAPCLRVLRTYVLRGFEREELLAVLGERGATERLLASNKRIRIRSGELLVEQFAKLRVASETLQNRTFFHFSFLGPIITEYRPRVDVDAYRQAVDRLLRNHKLNAVFAIEFQPITNYPQRGEGRGFLINAHALAWNDDPSFVGETAAASMRKTKALHSEFGAPTVTCTDRNLDAGQLEWLGYYLSKAPASGKRRHHDEELGRWSLKPVRTIRADLQLRLMELLSHFDFTDLVHGVSGGKDVRKAWKSELQFWNRTQCGRYKHVLEADFDVGELWRRIRARDGNGSRLCGPIQFLGPRPKPLAKEILPRSGGARIRPGEPRIRFKKGHTGNGYGDQVKALRSKLRGDLGQLFKL